MKQSSKLVLSAVAVAELDVKAQEVSGRCCSARLWREAYAGVQRRQTYEERATARAKALVERMEEMEQDR
jgi:hypothetical protein